MPNKLDFLAIGDITTDAFIRLKEASVSCDIDNVNCTLSMRFADKIPYESVEIVRAVGNSPNASVSAARLGLSSGLVTDIGDDENGKECVDVLKKEKVDTTYVSTHAGAKTNYHYVLLYEAERTILVKHEEYPYKFPPVEPSPKWIYLSSLGGNSEQYHYELTAYLEKHPEIQLSFQPGTFQMKLGKEKLAKLYERSSLFFCNREESQRILDTKETDIKTLLTGMHALGPKIVCITDGPKGAYAYDGHMNEYWFMPIYPDPKPPVSRTGAGDAFASTFTVAIILGKSVREALTWAPINSAYVVQEVGAQKGLLSREQLLKYLETAQSDYQPRKL
ncbi:MAG: carbohydrate kinase family protein [Candidatus Taylorbacteria bacterium]|nr:carbohydrate kinase family protein [Candidatus Taylorbacteria bacterium]